MGWGEFWSEEIRTSHRARQALFDKHSLAFESENSWEWELWEKQSEGLNTRAVEAAVLFHSDPEASWEIYQDLASRKHVPSIYSIGLFYAKGVVVERDNEQASHWFKNAWDAGSWLSGLQYAKMLRRLGRDDEAIDWFAEAADSGHLPSNYRLAEMLHPERKNPTYRRLIRQLLEQLVKKNHIGARHMLGRMMLRGEFGLLMRLKGAHMLFKLTKETVAEVASLKSAES